MLAVTRPPLQALRLQLKIYQLIHNQQSKFVPLFQLRQKKVQFHFRPHKLVMRLLVRRGLAIFLIGPNLPLGVVRTARP